MLPARCPILTSLVERKPIFASPSARPPRALPGLLFVLLILLVYADPLLLRRNFAGRDLLGFNLPVEKAVHDAYARGRLPVWIPEVSGGRPLLPNPNMGALYPVRALLAFVAFPLAMRVYPLLHWALAGVGMLAMLRSIGLSPAAGWVGAVTYVFSGASVTEVFYTSNQPGVTLLPWILWAAWRPMARPGRRVILLSLLFGLDFLAGDVFTIMLAVTACGLWILIGEEKPGRMRALGQLISALLLAGALAAPQIVASALWVPETHRGVTGLKIGEAFRLSLAPWRLFELFVPYLFGPTWASEPRATWAPAAFGGLPIGFFTTLYAGAFAAVALVGCWRWRGPVARFARILFLLGVGLSTLPSLTLFRWSHLPAPIPLRHPEKFAVAIVLALSILAALAIEKFRGPAREIRWPLILGIALAVAAAGAAVAPMLAARLAVQFVGSGASSARAAAAHLPGTLAEGGLLWMSAVVAIGLLRRPRPLSLAAALALLTLGPIAASRRIATTFREEEVFAPSPFARAIGRIDPSGAFRTLAEPPYLPVSRLEDAQVGSDVAFLEFDRSNWLFFTSVLWKRGTVFNNDYDAGDLSRVESLRGLSFRALEFRHPEAFFGNVCLKFGIRFPDQPPAPGYRRFGGNALQTWDIHEAALSDVRLLETWRESASAISALRQLPDLSQGELVLETGLEGRGCAREGAVGLLEKSPERLRVVVEAPDPTWLFVLRSFWTYRDVEVDGVSVSPVPAQLAFSAVRVPAGHHRIDWRERVPGGEASACGPPIYALAAAAILLRERRR